MRPPYGPSASLIGEPAGAWTRWYDALARRGVADPATIVQAYRTHAAQVGLNADLALAQAAHETGWFASAAWRDRRNPAGIGITGPGVEGPTFPTIEAGVKAHLAHLCCYAYAANGCPVHGARALWGDPRHSFHDGRPRLADLIRPERSWAVPGTGYVAAIARIANAMVAPRVIVHVGHHNIAAITAEKIGQASADRLRTATGAGGAEVSWTIPWGVELTRLLNDAGADAVLVDAIYRPVYADGAALVIAGHMDGVPGTGAPQWCMASAVYSGPSTEATDAHAAELAAAWSRDYPRALGIPRLGPVTEGMAQYYGGHYRTAETPMVLMEHGILYDGAGRRADAPDPLRAAAADATIVAGWLGLDELVAGGAYAVGEGVRAAMAAIGDEPASHEQYTETEQGTYSVTIGRKAVYYWSPTSGVATIRRA